MEIRGEKEKLTPMRRSSPFLPGSPFPLSLHSSAALRLVRGAVLVLLAACGSPPAPQPAPEDLSRQTREAAAAKSAGCLTCHTMAEDKPGPGLFDDPNMHVADARVGCTDCHGGNAAVRRPEGAAHERPYAGAYLKAMKGAHVQPRYPDEWPSSANPVRTFTLLNREDPAYVRFVNPGDLRAAPAACGACHLREVEFARRSLMTTSAMLPGAATYNNGSLPLKRYAFGESYGPDGEPARLETVPPPTPEESAKHGILASLDPLPRFEVGQPSNVLRRSEERRVGKECRL